MIDDMDKRKCPICGKTEGESSFCEECGWDFTVELEERTFQTLGEQEKKEYNDRILILKKNYETCRKTKEMEKAHRGLESAEESIEYVRENDLKGKRLKLKIASFIRIAMAAVMIMELFLIFHLDIQLQHSKTMIMRQAKENARLKQVQEEMEQSRDGIVQIYYEDFDNSGELSTDEERGHLQNDSVEKENELDYHFLISLVIKNGMISKETAHVIWKYDVV